MVFPCGVCWRCCCKDSISNMSTAPSLATVQSKRQMWDSQFDGQTFISVVWKGRVKQLVVVISRQGLLFNDQVERMWQNKSALHWMNARLFTVVLPQLSTILTFNVIASSISRVLFLSFFFLFQCFHHYQGMAMMGKQCLFHVCYPSHKGRIASTAPLRCSVTFNLMGKTQHCSRLNFIEKVMFIGNQFIHGWCHSLQS